MEKEGACYGKSGKRASLGPLENDGDREISQLGQGQPGSFSLESQRSHSVPSGTEYLGREPSIPHNVACGLVCCCDCRTVPVFGEGLGNSM